MSTYSVFNNQRKNKIFADNLSKYYMVGKRRINALDTINLEIYEGEFFCLLGPSGCGKSTLLNILAGFIRPTSGSVSINGIEHANPDPRYIVMDQEYGLFPWRTVMENVKFGLEINHTQKQDQEKVAQKFINLVQLHGFEDRHPFELSGGMKQRVTLARLLAINPEIIFMDEPFNAVDIVMRFNLQEEITKIWHEYHKTIVLVTHDIEEAIFLGDRIAIMKHLPGKIEKIIDIKLDRPRDRSSYEFHKLENEIFREITKR